MSEKITNEEFETLFRQNGDNEGENIVWDYAPECASDCECKNCKHGGDSAFYVAEETANAYGVKQTRYILKCEHCDAESESVIEKKWDTIDNTGKIQTWASIKLPNQEERIFEIVEED